MPGRLISRGLRDVFVDLGHACVACVSGPAFPHPSVSDGGGLVGRSTIYYLIGTTAHQRPTHERAVRARPLCTRAALLPSRLALPVPHADCSGVCSPPQSSVDATLQAAQAIHAPYRLCRGRREEYVRVQLYGRAPSRFKRVHAISITRQRLVPPRLISRTPAGVIPPCTSPLCLSRVCCRHREAGTAADTC